MHCTKQLSQDVIWVGTNDRRLALFENQYPIPSGVSYNAYVVLDEKTALLDTADRATVGPFFENVEHALAGRALDYLIVNHMEPDHAAAIADVLRCWPDVQIVTTAKSLEMIRQFFGIDASNRTIVVKEGDTLTTGRHTFRFVMAPMVHWPECMVTFDETDGTLYSGDAFGTFGALNGTVYADEVHFERDWLSDARRYYTNIVGKYGSQVQALLKKAQALDIRQIYPLHGPLWRRDIGWFLEKYNLWSMYTPEDQAVVIAYGSMYGHTERAAEILAFDLAEEGIADIVMYDVSTTDMSHLVAEAFRCSHIVLASVTHNAELYAPMHHFVSELRAHHLQKRNVAVIESGTWAISAGKHIVGMLSEMKDMHMLGEVLTIRSAAGPDRREALRNLAKDIAASIKG